MLLIDLEGDMNRDEKQAKDDKFFAGYKRKIDLSDQDIYEAMKDVPGYLDITPGDLKEIYLHAYKHACLRLTNRVKAKDIMTGDVIFIDPDASLDTAARIMAAHGISGLPVLDGSEIVGVVSERDILAFLGIESLSGLLAVYMNQKDCTAHDFENTPVAKVMSSPAITVGEDTPLIEVADLFATNKINRVPVVNVKGTMKGIVSRGDAMKALSGAI
jgi:CBS domain-containing membrane protein